MKHGYQRGGSIRVAWAKQILSLGARLRRAEFNRCQNQVNSIRPHGKWIEFNTGQAAKMAMYPRHRSATLEAGRNRVANAQCEDPSGARGRNGRGCISPPISDKIDSAGSES